MNLIILTLVMMILVVLLALGFGAVNVNFMNTLKIIGHHLPKLDQIISLDGIKESHITIIMHLRLPRIIVALFTGAALAIVGCAFQGVFKNPMADPFVIGISSGAALGATIGLILNLSSNVFGFTGVSICAFFGALITVLVVLKIAAIQKKLPTTTLLLAGISINYLFSALISLLMILNRHKLESVYLWTLGSFNASKWSEVMLIIPVVVIGSVILWMYSKELNIMLLGDDDASTLGIHVHRTKKIILCVSSLMVAVVVSASGIIAFVGLIIPHTVRILSGPNHKRLIPLAMIVGGIFMVICDTIARTVISPAELSVGIITSLFGVPFFLGLLNQSKKKMV